MFAATVALTALLAGAMTFAAARKLTHQEPVVRSYERVGVPEDRLNHLAAILLAGAAGMLLGLWWAPLGIAATTGATGYFLIAVAAHVRAGDTRNLPTPLVLTITAAAALLLRIATL